MTIADPSETQSHQCLSDAKNLSSLMVFTYEVIELQRYQLIIDTRDVQSKQMEVLLLYTRGVLQMLGSLFMQATRQPPPARMQNCIKLKSDCQS